MGTYLLMGSVAALSAVFLLYAGLALTRAMRSNTDSVEDGSPLFGGAAAEQPALEMEAVFEDVPFRDERTDEMDLGLYRLALGVPDFEQSVGKEHDPVRKLVKKSMRKAISQRQYFPRRPLVIPKLLRAIKSEESSKRELVDIIMQDPMLTGDVLRLANSSFYRISTTSVDTIGRAVVLLGLEGLRSVVSISVMQPVFQVPKGYFDSFSETIWDQALKSAVAAQIYARQTRSCDSFTAHLLGLLVSIGHIVIFRLTVHCYMQVPDVMPRAEVFKNLLFEYGDRVSKLVAEDWELADHIVVALNEYIDQSHVNEMSPLSRALYYGRRCATSAVLFERGVISEDDAKSMLLDKGLDERIFKSIWNGLRPASAEDAATD